MPDFSNDHSQSALRAHILDLLRGRNAHLDFETAVAGLHAGHRGVKPAGAPHSIWQLVEHLRIAQLDILEFSRDARHQSPKWPDDYWPDSESPGNEADWAASLARFEQDQKAFSELIASPRNDLLAPLANAPQQQTLLREALVLSDHNSYHIGQIVGLRKILESQSHP